MNQELAPVHAAWSKALAFVQLFPAQPHGLPPRAPARHAIANDHGQVLDSLISLLTRDQQAHQLDPILLIVRQDA